MVTVCLGWDTCGGVVTFGGSRCRPAPRRTVAAACASGGLWLPPRDGGPPESDGPKPRGWSPPRRDRGILAGRIRSVADRCAPAGDAPGNEPAEPTGGSELRTEWAHEAPTPSHPVDLARLVADHVPHPASVDPAGGCPAAARAAASGEAGVGVAGRREGLGDRTGPEAAGAGEAPRREAGRSAMADDRARHKAVSDRAYAGAGLPGTRGRRDRAPSEKGHAVTRIVRCSRPYARRVPVGAQARTGGGGVGNGVHRSVSPVRAAVRGARPPPPGRRPLPSGRGP